MRKNVDKKKNIWNVICDGDIEKLKSLLDDPQSTVKAHRTFHPNEGRISSELSMATWYNYLSRLAYAIFNTDSELEKRVFSGDQPIHYALRCRSLRSIKVFIIFGSENDKEIINSYIDACKNPNIKGGYITIDGVRFPYDFDAHNFALNIAEFIAENNKQHHENMTINQKLLAQEKHYNSQLDELNTQLQKNKEKLDTIEKDRTHLNEKIVSQAMQLRDTQIAYEAQSKKLQSAETTLQSQSAELSEQKKHYEAQINELKIQLQDNEQKLEDAIKENIHLHEKVASQTKTELTDIASCAAEEIYAAQQKTRKYAEHCAFFEEKSSFDQQTIATLKETIDGLQSKLSISDQSPSDALVQIKQQQKMQGKEACLIASKSLQLLLARYKRIYIRKRGEHDSQEMPFQFQHFILKEESTDNVWVDAHLLHQLRTAYDEASLKEVSPNIAALAAMPMAATALSPSTPATVMSTVPPAPPLPMTPPPAPPLPMTPPPAPPLPTNISTAAPAGRNALLSSITRFNTSSLKSASIVPRDTGIQDTGTPHRLQVQDLQEGRRQLKNTSPSSQHASGNTVISSPLMAEMKQKALARQVRQQNTLATIITQAESQFTLSMFNEMKLLILQMKQDPDEHKKARFNQLKAYLDHDFSSATEHKNKQLVRELNRYHNEIASLQATEYSPQDLQVELHKLENCEIRSIADALKNKFKNVKPDCSATHDEEAWSDNEEPEAEAEAASALPTTTVTKNAIALFTVVKTPPSIPPKPTHKSLTSKINRE